VATVSNGNCSSTGTVTVTVAPELIAGFTADTTSGGAPLTVNFTSNTANASVYNWDFGDGGTGTGQTTSHTYANDGNFIVTLAVENSLGCSDTARYSFIDVIASLIVPNVFTPNGDGTNDTFHLEEKGLSSVSAMFFNRWGNEVYSWSGLNGSWNGKSTDGSELPDGVYLVIIKASGASGKSFDYQGTVQLIRNKD
jgi:gliding motility-associated-like protein